MSDVELAALAIVLVALATVGNTLMLRRHRVDHGGALVRWPQDSGWYFYFGAIGGAAIGMLVGAWLGVMA